MFFNLVIIGVGLVVLECNGIGSFDAYADAASALVRQVGKSGDDALFICRIHAQPVFYFDRSEHFFVRGRSRPIALEIDIKFLSTEHDLLGRYHSAGHLNNTPSNVYYTCPII